MGAHAAHFVNTINFGSETYLLLYNLTQPVVFGTTVFGNCKKSLNPFLESRQHRISLQQWKFCGNSLLELITLKHQFEDTAVGIKFIA